MSKRIRMATGFHGLRVVTFESRLSQEMNELVRRLGGVVLAAPAMRELPIPQSPAALEFAENLLAGRVDVVIFLTGVGARALMSIMERVHPRTALVEGLKRVMTVARGSKPAAVLHEWGVTPTLTAAEPNTWREVLVALDEAGPIGGKRVVVQEYGLSNPPLIDALRQRGAEVASAPVFTWALPEDLEPLKTGIHAIVDGRIDVAVFTTGQQVHHLLQVARSMEVEDGLRDALRRVVTGSIGPMTSEALRAEGLGVDYEPDDAKMTCLVRGLARSAVLCQRRKIASEAAGVDTTRARRVDLVWSAEEAGEAIDPLHASAFLCACRREKTSYTPIWIMRQAGRYQRAYRAFRARYSFLEMCRTPELAAEVTLLAVDQLGVDAAILFSDILLVAEPLGRQLTYEQGHGPAIRPPVRTGRDVDSLRAVDVPGALGYVFETVRLARRALHPAVPLLGFAGAPFTVASYLIEGGPSKDLQETRMLIYRDPGVWNALMERLVVVLADYLNGQIDSGVQAVQLFDSWVGWLNVDDYRAYVQPHVRELIQRLKPGVPIIHFGTHTAALLTAMKQAGGDVIGLDWRVDLAQAWEQLGYDVGVQGNLDPVVLLASPSEIRRRAQAILDKAAGRPGHIFNLGHGVLPSTPVEHVIALVDAVHELSANRS